MIVEMRSPHGQEPELLTKVKLHGFAGENHRVVAICQPLDGSYLFEMPLHRIVMPEVVVE